jgi:hypothetical protein
VLIAPKLLQKKRIFSFKAPTLLMHSSGRQQPPSIKPKKAKMLFKKVFESSLLNNSKIFSLKKLDLNLIITSIKIKLELTLFLIFYLDLLMKQTALKILLMASKENKKWIFKSQREV